MSLYWNYYKYGIKFGSYLSKILLLRTLHTTDTIQSFTLSLVSQGSFFMGTALPNIREYKICHTINFKYRNLEPKTKKHNIPQTWQDCHLLGVLNLPSTTCVITHYQFFRLAWKQDISSVYLSILNSRHNLLDVKWFLYDDVVLGQLPTRRQLHERLRQHSATKI